MLQIVKANMRQFFLRSNSNGLTLKIDIAPSKSQNFAASQAIEKTQNNSRTKEIVTGAIQQSSGFFHSVSNSEEFLFIWQGDLFDRIGRNNVLAHSFFTSTL